jgi:hypothetical protein
MRRLIPLGRREHDAGRAARPEELQRGVEEEPADAPAAVPRVDDDVVQDSGRPAQRHVVITLDGGVRVADHVPSVVADEDGHIRVFELGAYERRVALLRPRPRCEEAPRVEAVMLLDEERAEAADGRQVGGRRAPDDGAGLGVRWRHIEALTSWKGSACNLFAEA